MSRCVRTLVTSAALAALAAVPAFANPRVCSGKNILTEMQTSDPALYAEIRAAADKTENAKHLLWKIENKEDEDKPPSYLFGTVHLTDDRVTTLSPKASRALAESSRAAVEIEDVSDGRVLEALQTLTSRGAVVGKKDNLSTLLSPAEFATTNKNLAKSGIDEPTLGKIRPWVALAMLGTPECEKGRLRTGRPTLDTAITRRAEAAGMGTFGLETLEVQFMSMAAIPDKDQLALLKAQIADPKRLDDMVETTVQLYLARDLGVLWPLQIALAKKAGVDPKVFESYEQNLLTDRNERMYGRLSMHLDRGGLFAAVGALHLPGKTGLVEQIRNAGFKVTPVE